MTETKGAYIISPLMQIRFLNKINLWKLAAENGFLEGEIPLNPMQRLTSLLKTSEGDAKVFMKASVDEQGVRFITGRIEVTVEMICQRCMETLQLPLAVEFRLGLVQAESQIASLPGEYEPLLVTEPAVAVSEVVEDELILALPLIPVHSDVSVCEAYGFALPKQAALQTKKPKPFNVLSTLFKDSDLKE